MIRPATPHDAPALCAIYNPYITDDLTSFEKEPVAEKAMAGRIRSISEDYPWLVYEQDNTILGFAYASQWKSRHAYRFAAETTIYLPQSTTRQGIGTPLYTELLKRITDQGITQAIACIAIPNPASTAFHAKLGYKEVAHFPKVGFKFDQWIDVQYWQKALAGRATNNDTPYLD